MYSSLPGSPNAISAVLLTFPAITHTPTFREEISETVSLRAPRWKKKNVMVPPQTRNKSLYVSALFIMYRNTAHTKCLCSLVHARCFPSDSLLIISAVVTSYQRQKVYPAVHDRGLRPGGNGCRNLQVAPHSRDTDKKLTSQHKYMFQE